MRVLVACEYSGTVRDAFTRAGHDAMSCDILPSLTPGKHYQGSALDLLSEPFDLVIAHPPCTYLARVSAPSWRYSDRTAAMKEGASFFWAMFMFNSPRICVENPVQLSIAKESHGMGGPTQYVEPYGYGHPYTKKTGLWLSNLPPLIPTNIVEPKGSYVRMVRSWKNRSRFHTGIAEAMAIQWGSLPT